jgi:hypothetical protein
MASTGQNDSDTAAQAACGGHLKALGGLDAMLVVRCPPADASVTRTRAELRADPSQTAATTRSPAELPPKSGRRDPQRNADTPEPQVNQDRSGNLRDPSTCHGSIWEAPQAMLTGTARSLDLAFVAQRLAPTRQSGAPCSQQLAGQATRRARHQDQGSTAGTRRSSRPSGPAHGAPTLAGARSSSH